MQFLGKHIQEILDESITSNLLKKYQIIFYTDTQAEGKAFTLVKKDRDQKSMETSIYSLGESANLYDMKKFVDNDSKMVNWVAIIAIALVLLVTFRSITIPLILLITIETAIWINLSVHTLLVQEYHLLVILLFVLSS